VFLDRFRATAAYKVPFSKAGWFFFYTYYSDVGFKVFGEMGKTGSRHTRG
jgi:hypothetical protein